MIRLRAVACLCTLGLIALACDEPTSTGQQDQQNIAAGAIGGRRNREPTVSITSPAIGASESAGTSALFSGTASDPEDGALSGASLVWTSSRDGQIGTGRTFSRGDLSVGSHVIILTARDSRGASATKSRTLNITGVVNQPPVATISAPGSGTSFVQGSVVTFAGSGTDPENGALSGAALTWMSNLDGSIGAGASFTKSTLTVGTHTIVLRAVDPQGASGMSSRTITITAPAPSAGGCAQTQPGWIWCDDFETNRFSSYFEYDNNGGDFIPLSGAGVGGSKGMRVRWQAGEVGAGNLKLAFGRTPSSYFRTVDGGTANYREIYWRMYVRNQAGWVGGGADKLSRATIFTSSSWSQAAIGHVWSMGNSLGIDPASGTDVAGNVITTTYNDFAHLRWLGARSATTALFASANVGQWYCVESRMKLNDAGQSNGVSELWINGVLQAQRTDLNWVGSYNAYGINAVFFENHWNAGSPVTQERYFDDLVVSTNRIGC